MSTNITPPPRRHRLHRGIIATILLVPLALAIASNNNQKRATQTANQKSVSTATIPYGVPICRSIEAYDRLAKSFSWKGDWPDGLQAEFFDQCNVAWDETPPTFEFYHVTKRENTYLCVTPLSLNECFWTESDRFRYIGHGPQQSDELFAQRQQWLIESNALRDKVAELRKVDEEYFNRAYRMAPLNPSEAERLYRLSDEARQKTDSVADQANELHDKAAYATTLPQKEHQK
jgi:hypothetical protein